MTLMPFALHSGRSATHVGRRLLVTAAALAGLAGVGDAAAINTISTVVAHGLNSPRGLAFGPDGALYIAEAGLASGAGPSIVVRGDPIIATESGSITRYLNGTQARVYTGLASSYNVNTGDVGGPNDIVFTSDGTARIAVGVGFDPTLRSSLGAIGARMGQLLTPNVGSIDVSAYEQTNNPAGGPLDSNPWHIASIAGATLVTDAGGNSLLRVSDAGVVSTVTTFAARNLGGPFPTEAVPTGLAVGPDGAYYVGELTGFPFFPGAAEIFRVLDNGTSSLFATGFTNIVDMAFGLDGSLYVLEYDANGILAPGSAGALWKIAVDGARSLLFSDGLSHPTGLAIGADGAFYISNFGDSAGAGSVIRVAVPEPQVIALLVAGLAGGWLTRRRATRRPATSTGRSGTSRGTAG